MKSKKISKIQKIRKNSNQSEFYSIADSQFNENFDDGTYVPLVLARTTNQIYVIMATTNGNLPLQIIQSRQSITLLPYQSYKIYFGCKIKQFPRIQIKPVDASIQITPDQTSLLRFTPSQNLQVCGIISTCKTWTQSNIQQTDMFITITNFTDHVITSPMGNNLGFLQLYTTRKYKQSIDPYTPPLNVDNKRQRGNFITSTCINCFDNSNNYQFSNLQIN